MQAMLQTTKEEASKAGGAKEKLAEELAHIKEEMASKSLEADSLRQSLKGREKDLQDKEKAVVDATAQLAAKTKETEKLLATIELLKKRQSVSAGASVSSDAGSTVVGTGTNAGEEVRRCSSASSCKRMSLTTPDLGSVKSDVHAAPMLTSRRASAISSDASASVGGASRTSSSGSKMNAEDEMSASVCTKIAAEAAAVAAAVAQEDDLAGDGGDLAAYLQPGEAEISFSEVDDKENAEGNAGAWGEGDEGNAGGQCAYGARRTSSEGGGASEVCCAEGTNASGL